MTTPQQETPELTEEQEQRLDKADLYEPGDDHMSFGRFKAHLATELELQRREYEEETEQLILLLHRKTKGRMNFTEEDLSGISYERRMKWQLSYEALLQKEQSVIK